MSKLQNPYQFGTVGTMNGQAGGALSGGLDPSATAPGMYTQLASWTAHGGIPVPVVLSTELVQSRNAEPQQSARYLVAPDIAAGDAWVDVNVQGNLLIQYGVGGVVRTRIIDAGSGTFQLPPCDSVVVQGRFYNQSSFGVGKAARMSASLAAGVLPDTSIATNSGAIAVAAGAVSGLYYYAPPGCFGWRVKAIPDDPIPGADIQLSVDGCHPHAYIDYVLPTYGPSTPDLAFVAEGLSVDKTGTGAGYVYVSALVGF